MSFHCLNGKMQQQSRRQEEDEMCITEQSRPSNTLLRCLGMWQPSNVRTLFHIYNKFLVLVIWLVAVCGIIWHCFIDGFRWGRLINAVGTICNLCAPFLITRHYFRYGKFDWLMHNVAKDVPVNKLIKVRLFYMVLSVAMWAIGFSFFYVHFLPYFTKTFHYILYGFILFYSLGWWAAWLGIYSYVCSCHKLQILSYIQTMKLVYGYSNGTKTGEIICVTKLLKNFTRIRKSMQQTQEDFSKIISFCVAYHILDLVVFSVAYWKNDFGRYSLWQYIGGVLFDTFSILFKLYPAAIVNQNLHQIVIVAGQFCEPNLITGLAKEDRFVFYHYLFLREKDLGMTILGVKVTSKVTVGIFVTIGSLGLTFLFYAVPFLTKIEYL